MWSPPRLSGHSASPASEPRLTLRRAQILLALLLLYLALWDMVAIARDNRLLLTDSLLEDMVWLQEEPFEAGMYGAWFEVWTQFKKGPLLPLVAMGVDYLVGNLVLAARSITLLAHWACMIALFVIGRRLAGRAAVGLWAVLIYGTFPGAYGWGRIGTYDPLVAPFLLGCMMLMIQRGPTVGRMVLLGVTAGLATLIRTSFPLFAGVPALLFLLDHVRRPGKRWLPLWAMGAAVLTVAWWLIPALGTLSHYATDSTDARQHAVLSDQLLTYMYDIKGTFALYVASLVGGVVAWIALPKARLGLAMAGSAVLVPMAILTGWFDPLARYAVPTFSVASLLVALGLGALWSRFNLPTTLAWLAAAALLGMHAWHNSGGYPIHPRGREMGAGMVTADTRAYHASPGVTRFCRKNGLRLYRLFDPVFYSPCPFHTGRAWRDRGLDIPMVEEHDQAKVAFLNGKSPIHILICHRDITAIKAIDQLLITAMNEDSAAVVTRVMGGRKKVLFTAADPYADTERGDIKLSVVRVDSR